ncbi:MAG: hypothetical protein ACLFPN_06415, partial [Methanomassiliicoccales archaeon]
MFHPEKELCDIIIDILKPEGKSISALSRELEDRGFKFHRLILTGYLRALTDLKILRVKEVPPAKIYVPAKPREKDIYEVIREQAEGMASGRGEANELILETLYHLFGRAIFGEELKRAGIRDEWPGEEAPEEEAEMARNFLRGTGFKVANSSRVVVPSRESEKFVDVLKGVIQEVHDIGHLAK